MARLSQFGHQNCGDAPSLVHSRRLAGGGGPEMECDEPRRLPRRTAEAVRTWNAPILETTEVLASNPYRQSAPRMTDGIG